MVRKFIMVVPIVALAIGGSAACATKKYVRTSVGDVNDKVDSLGRSVEATQERTRQNEGRISEVDQKAQAAAQGPRPRPTTRPGRRQTPRIWRAREPTRPPARPTPWTRRRGAWCTKSC